MNRGAGIILAVQAVIVVALALASWEIVDTVSQPPQEKSPPCRGEFGHPRPQSFCDNRDN